MLEITLKIAYIALAVCFLVNPAPVEAAKLTGIWNAPSAPLLVKTAETIPHYGGALIPSKQKEARWTTVRTVTAYSSTPDQTDDTPFITANGTRVRDGIVAANWLRFGTRVRIPEMYGDKVFTVTDRMHPRHDEKVDVWMETRGEALEFGKRRLTIEIL